MTTAPASEWAVQTGAVSLQKLTQLVDESKVHFVFTLDPPALDGDRLADLAIAGLRYHLGVELYRLAPLIATFYDIELTYLGEMEGSRKQLYEIGLKAKDWVVAAYEKAGPIAVFALLVSAGSLGLAVAESKTFGPQKGGIDPGAMVTAHQSASDALKNTVTAAGGKVVVDLPQANSNVTIIDARISGVFISNTNYQDNRIQIETPHIPKPFPAPGTATSKPGGTASQKKPASLVCTVSKGSTPRGQDTKPTTSRKTPRQQ